ncbi:MAG: Snf7 family protein [Candidatus Bathyarchaeia archaeon]
MPSKAIRGWVEADHSGRVFGGGVGPRGSSLKERLNFTVHKLRSQSERLDHATSKIRKHDQRLFQKCVEAQLSKDRARAIMYANECAELRRILKTTLSCHLALEHVTLRLETVKDFGEVAALMRPVASIISTVKGRLSGIMPEVSYELGEIFQDLDELACDFGETVASEPGGFSSEEAESIIHEANAVAEQRVREKFPDLPEKPVPVRGLEPAGSEA